MTICKVKKNLGIIAAGAVLAVTGFAGIASEAALAQAGVPVPIEQFRAWTAYKDNSGGKQVCFAASVPESYVPADQNRHGNVLFFISRRPADNVSGETSLSVGYNFLPNSEVVVDVDGEKFYMFTNGQGAWIKNAGEDPALINAMKAGRRMTVSGRSARENDTRYEFSLSGVTAAVDRISKECS